MVNPRSRLTKYEKVRAHIMELIDSGSVKVGDNLPGEMELAEKLGVSRNTVRHAFVELVQRGIVQRTRRKGTVYIGDRTSDSVAKTVGIVSSWLVHNIYPEIIHGLEDGLYHGGCTMVLANGNHDHVKERESINRMLEQGIAGLIIEPYLSATLGPEDDFFKLLDQLDIPVLTTNCVIPGLRASAVTVDDRSIGRKATEYLLGLGHRRIACIYKSDNQAGLLRHEGYRTALDRAGVAYEPALVADYSETFEGRQPGAELTERIFDRVTPRPTAFFYFNDEMAVQGYDFFASRDLRIPDDVSVVGVDNLRESSLVSPPLTTFNHPKYVMGKVAAELMLARINTHVYHSEYTVNMDLDIIERGSTGTVDAGAKAIA